MKKEPHTKSTKGTKIEWTDFTWNFLGAFLKGTDKRGWFCTKCSAGCLNCYAEAFNRFRGNGLAYIEANRDKIEFRAVNMEMPFGIRKPARIFVGSMTDIFQEGVPQPILDQAFAIMALCPEHTFQILTKRPDRMRDYLTSPTLFSRLAYWMAIKAVARATPRKITAFSATCDGADRLRELRALWDKLPAFPNVHLGATMEDQTQFKLRWPILRQIPAAARFISCEPMLEEIDFNFRGDTSKQQLPENFADLSQEQRDEWYGSVARANYIARSENPDQVIFGGESGQRARGCMAEWIWSGVDQCRRVGIPVFVKQLGARCFTGNANAMEWPARTRFGVKGDLMGYGIAAAMVELKSKKGGDIKEFPVELRFRELISQRDAAPAL